MSRITGREVSELMEAYQAIYAPQEEVVEEDIENAEVFDEKMDVFSAIGNTPSPVFTKPQQQPRKGMGGAIDRGVADASKAAALKFFTKGMQPAGGRPATPGTPARPAAPARPGTPSPAASAPRPAGQTVAAAGGKGGTVTVGTKYAATLGGQKGNVTYDAAGKKTFTADKPAAVKPAPATPAVKPATPAPATTTSKPITTQPAVSKSQASAAEIRGMVGRSMERQADEVKRTAEIAKKTTQPTVAPTPTQMRQGTFREEIDAYDLVLDYLLENGHVNTLDEAHYVMLEMDSEMIQSIVEAKYGTAAGRKALAKDIRKGKNIGKKGPGTGFKAVEKAAKKGGAEDPEAVAAAAMWKTYGKGKKGKTQKEW